MISLGIYAQDENTDFQSNKSQRSSSDYFPKAGDFGIGFEATPFLDYLGNAFNGTSGNSLNLGDNTLYFRYFLTDNSAVRLALQIGSYKSVENEYVLDDAAAMNDPLSQKQIQDRRISNEDSYLVRAGYQMFKGNNRLRGFVGGDLAFGYGRELVEYEYGNSMTNLNPDPTTAWGGMPVGKRYLEQKEGSSIILGVGAFTGAEYYFMPNVSIGVELGLLYGQMISGQGYEKLETMVNSQYVVEDVEVEAGSRGRGFFTGMPSSYGNLYFMIHF